MNGNKCATSNFISKSSLWPLRPAQFRIARQIDSARRQESIDPPCNYLTKSAAGTIEFLDPGSEFRNRIAQKLVFCLSARNNYAARKLIVALECLPSGQKQRKNGINRKTTREQDLKRKTRAGNRAANRNAHKIASMLEEGKTYQEIGNYFGVSRQRAHQLAAIYAPEEAKRRTKDMRAKPKGECGVCGKPLHSFAKSCGSECARILQARKKHDRFVQCVNLRRGGFKWKEVAKAVGFKTAMGAYNFTAMEFRSRKLPGDVIEKFFASTPPSRIKEWLRAEIDENSWEICLKRP